MKSYYDVNSSRQKDWDNLETNPQNCRYTNNRMLLLAIGFKEFNGAGSRVRFYDPETGIKILLHRPHPGDKMEVASAKDVREAIHAFYKQES